MNPPLDPEFIDGSAGKLAVHHLGGSGDQTLIVAHATGFLGRVYRAMARELRDAVEVVALDFRGHGDSDTPATEDGFRWAGMADDLEAVITHLDRPSLHAFGHSMGGAAVLEVERRSPGTFTSAMVFEPIILDANLFGDNSMMKDAALGRLRTFPSRAEAVARYASKPPLGLFRADVLHDYVTHGFADVDGGITLKCTPENEANTFGNAGQLQLDVPEHIELDIVVAMSGDGGLPAGLAEPVADRLVNGRLQSFPTLTHFGPLQDPVLVANAVRDLVGASSPTP